MQKKNGVVYLAQPHKSHHKSQSHNDFKYQEENSRNPNFPTINSDLYNKKQKRIKSIMQKKNGVVYLAQPHKSHYESQSHNDFKYQEENSENPKFSAINSDLCNKIRETAETLARDLTTPQIKTSI